MKKYRPLAPGFIVLYVLSVLCIGDAIWALVTTYITKTAHETMASFNFFTYLIAILAIMYVWIYIRSRIEIGSDKMRIVCPFYIVPKEGAKRASFIYRQGNTDLKLIDKTFSLKELDRFGYIEDLGYSRLDASQADENNILFPVREVALVLKDGKRYHMNAGLFKPEVVKQMVDQITEISGVQPTGALADPIAADAKRRADKAAAKNKAKGKGKKKK